MKFHLISDNTETQNGMRLAGIDGVVVHTKEEVTLALKQAVSDDSIGIVLMTQKLVKLCEEYVFDLKLNRQRPLIVEIPDRHAGSDITESIERYVREAIGIKM